MNDYNQQNFDQQQYGQQPQQNYQPYYQQPQQVREHNGIGTAGFILSLLGLILCWFPFVNIILWFLGLLFSFIGLFKRPKGLAIAGFVLSFITVIVFIVLVVVLGVVGGFGLEDFLDFL